jgi:Response regulator of citrate/malate metabolism
MEKLFLPNMKPNTARQFNFYQIPKSIIDNKIFTALDGWSIILYGMFLNRASLSAENYNDYTDQNGDLYIIFTVEEAMQRCHKSKPSCVKYFKQLEDVGLIEKKRQGLGRPSIIYVKDFSCVDPVYLLKSNIFTSGSKDIELQEVKNIYPSNNDNNNNDFSNNESYLISSTVNKNIQDEFSSYDKIRNTISSQIELKYLKFQHPQKTIIGDIFEIMVEIASSNKPYYKISGENIPTYEVQQRLLRISSDDIELLIEQFNNQRGEIRNIKAYLIKCLYDLPVTTNAYWENQVRNDKTMY